MYQSALQEQITLIEHAMKKAGVWSDEAPDWIINFQEGPIVNIWEWLQFIHLPMRSNGAIRKADYLAPRLSSYMNNDNDQRHILQLVIELDSISSTINKY